MCVYTRTRPAYSITSCTAVQLQSALLFILQRLKLFVLTSSFTKGSDKLPHLTGEHQKDKFQDVNITPF
jgi:hypothetical protein